MLPSAIPEVDVIKSFQNALKRIKQCYWGEDGPQKPAETAQW